VIALPICYGEKAKLAVSSRPYLGRWQAPGIGPIANAILMGRMLMALRYFSCGKSH